MKTAYGRSAYYGIIYKDDDGNEYDVCGFSNGPTGHFIRLRSRTTGTVEEAQFIGTAPDQSHIYGGDFYSIN